MSETPVIEMDRSFMLSARIQQLASDQPNHPALVQDGRIMSWSEMAESINQIGHVLSAEGIRPKERVALLGRNSIEYSLAYCGIVCAGCSAVPLSTMINSATLLNLLLDSEAQLLLITEEFIPLFQSIADKVPALTGRIVLLDGLSKEWPSFESWIRDQPTVIRDIEVHPDDEFNIIYSSGTTGIPKGIIHTHRIRYAMSRKYFESGAISINLVSTPLYSNTTIVCWLPTLYSGGTNVIMPRFNATKALSSIEAYKIDTAMFVPVQYDRLLQEANFDDYNLSSMKNKFCTSAPLRPHLKKALLERFPGRLTEIYGLTEGGPTTIFPVTDYPDRLDSVGKVVEGGLLHVIDDQGNILPPNEIGELVGRHSNMSKGYLKKPAITKAMHWYDPSGLLFYRSGDTGYIDEEGFVYLLDRKKDMIISGGFNIYATDLELALLSHPDIHDAAVIAAPSDRWGETPVAYVLREKEAKISEELLLSWVNQRLNKFQRISEIIFKEDLPKSPIGKILKRQLRKEYNDYRLS